MQPRRISILGVGLLGGSIGLAVKQRISGCQVVGYGHRTETLIAAQNMGAIDEGYAELQPAVRRAELVILCTPVGLLSRILGELAGLLEPGTVVTDVGSTKRSVVVAGEQSLPKGVHFVGSHPMAGSEKRGVQYAKADLYDGALCILTPTPRTDLGALKAVESFWQTLGMRTTKISPDDHDRRLADISHLPHAAAAALVTLQDESSLALTGKGFLDVTRIAGGDGALWRDILIDNRDNVRQSIARFREQLEKLEKLLEPGQAEALAKWLDQAARKRDRMSKPR